MRILAYHPGHDGAAALIDGAKLVYSLESEKDDWPQAAAEFACPDHLHDFAGTAIFALSCLTRLAAIVSERTPSSTGKDY